MPQDASRLIWIDMEMTGLKPDSDRIIEGSPKNSTSTVPIMPWGSDPIAKCADWIEK